MLVYLLVYYGLLLVYIFMFISDMDHCQATWVFYSGHVTIEILWEIRILAR